MHRWIVCLRAGLIFSPLLGGCAPAPPQLVVFAVADAARGDRVSYAGYEQDTTPFLASLADGHALVSLKHFSQGAATRSAMPRLFYSRYFAPSLFPGSSKIPLASPYSLFSRLDDRAISIPSAFSQSGFQTLGVSAHTWMRPGTEFVALFDEFHDLGANGSEPYREAPAVVDVALSALEQARGSDVFLYLHFMDTHWPYRFGQRARVFLGQGAVPADTAPLEGGTVSLSTREREYYDAIYDGSLRRIDDQLRRLVETVDGRGAFQRVGLVVTADHGEHLGEVSGRWTHGGRLYDAVAHIPLLISAPLALTERVILNTPTESVDVLPTLVDLFGLKVPTNTEFDGETLVAGKTDGIAMAPDAIRTATEKVVGAEPDVPLWQQNSVEYYRVDLDPLETEDLSAEHGSRVEELVALHRELQAHSYHRSRNARSQELPKLPFAIASKDFVLTPAEEGEDEPFDAWHQVRNSKSYQLSCRTTPCGPVELSFPMPNGQYALTVGYIGFGEIALPEGDNDGYQTLPESRDLSMSDFDSPQDQELTTATYGSIRVSGGSFRARLRVPEGSGLIIRYLGFVPSGAELRSDQAIYEARLRALGYLQ